MIKRQVENDALDLYITDCLKMIAESTAKYAGGSYPRARFSDIIKPLPQDQRNGAEIIEHIKQKLGSG